MARSTGRSRTPSRRPLLALLLLAAGCRTAPEVPPDVAIDVAEPAAAWRRVATSEDGARIDALGQRWTAGLAAARRGGFARRIATEGPLLDPRVALPQALLPPGSYRCRVLRLAGRPGRSALTVFPTHFCQVAHDGDRLSLTKQTGGERPGGYLWPDGDNRMIFLGAVAEGSERLPPAYRANRRRDIVGVVERIGPLRYRVAMTRADSSSALDILELVPAATQNES